MVITREQLLLRANKIMASHREKESLTEGEFDADLLAISVISYIENAHYSEVIKEWSQE